MIVMNKKLKIMFLRIMLSAIFLVSIMFLSVDGWTKFFLFLIPYFIIGWDVVYKTIKHLCKFDLLDENSLMFIATVGAFALGEYIEAVVVILLYQIGELFQSCAVDYSRKSISSLMDIRPDYANLKRQNNILQVAPETVNVGDIIVVKPGEKIPLDGVIKNGSSTLDTSSMTGESVPTFFNKGDEVVSGYVNISGLLEVEVSKVFSESTVVKVLDLIENAKNKKAKSEEFIRKFAKYYTPCVVLAAFFLAVLPTLVFSQDVGVWIERALIFLVISCPCALVISIPMSLFGGIGGASKNGILVKGGNYLEMLSRINTVVFDKTGTLTNGTFDVIAINPVNMTESELIELAALAETHINNPIANSIKNKYGVQNVDEHRIKKVTQIDGMGVEAIIDDNKVCLGNSKFMEHNRIVYDRDLGNIGTIVYIALNGKYVGNIVIADEIKVNAKKAIEQLNSEGIENVVILTGDRKTIAGSVAKKLGINNCYSELLPNEKVEKLEKFIYNGDCNSRVAFVGDGVNDAPALSLADVGISMGAIGSQAAMEAADVVIMDDNIQKIPMAIKISKKTMNIVRQNIVFSLGVKAVILSLGAVGITNMWFAIFADVGVSIIAILNALRALRIKTDQ